MALTAVQIQARIETLKTARDAGVSSIQHGDTKTVWRSLEELERIIASLQAQLAGLNGTKKPRVNYIEQSSKGYDTKFRGGGFDG